MTRRERLERKMAKRLDWAASRAKKSEAAFDGARKIADNIPLGQPILVGHHSEKRARKDAERIHNGMSRGVEHADMAAHHRSAAAGLEYALERSIFSDDPDAIEALKAKIADLEAERDRAKAINKAIKKGTGLFEARLATLGFELTEKEYKDLMSIARHTPYHCDKATGYPVFPGYHFTSLGARIRTAAARIKEIEARAVQAEKAEAAEGGVLVEDLGSAGGVSRPYTKVTFAEKPDRKVIDALKAAGYWWSRGSWVGYTDALPEGIRK